MNNFEKSDNAIYEESLMDYWRVIRRHILYIVLVIAVACAASWFYSNRQKAYFKSHVTLKYEEKKPSSDVLSSMVAFSSGDPIETETKVIKKFDIVKEKFEHLWIHKVCIY